MVEVRVSLSFDSLAKLLNLPCGVSVRGVEPVAPVGGAAADDDAPPRPHCCRLVLSLSGRSADEALGLVLQGRVIEGVQLAARPAKG
jgi:hypothetical protein